MPVHSVTDDLDARLVHALQLDGRAPFSTLAAVLGTSPQTVARRYARLREPGGLRVIGRTDPPRDRVRWMVRLSSTPDAAVTIAQAVARRADASFVALASGGTEVICVAEGPGDMSETPLLRRLPQTPRVVAVRAHQLLHLIFGGRSGWYAKLDALSSEQVAALRPPVPSGDPVTPDRVDHLLLEALSRDGRTGSAALSRIAAVTESSVRRRVQRLRDAGLLYFDLQLDPAVLGYHSTTLLWLSVTPARLEPVAAELAGHAEVAFAAVTTGRANIVAALICRTADDLYRYLTRSLSPLDGIVQVETVPVMRQVKHLTSDGLVRPG
ncbi:Lrp/AsnC family transcriptional regulator [Actinoallomurus acaciae]|uniref:Lrp/AsnC family transcriptional regulator n=2 Tax=Actinoallomurus acaciae TaxID=502577 RepID=A0ABV5YHQ1_9ACTN